MAPLNVVLVLSVPTVRMSVPLLPMSVTVPPPVSEPMVWLKPPRLKVVTLPTLTVESGEKALAAPPCRTPVAIVVLLVAIVVAPL